jgi:hypothetical protein
VLVALPCNTCSHSDVCKHREFCDNIDIHVPKQATFPSWFRIAFTCTHYEAKKI